MIHRPFSNTNSDQLTGFLANQEAGPANQYAASRLLQQYLMLLCRGVQKRKGQNLSSFEKKVSIRLHALCSSGGMPSLRTFTAMNLSNYEKESSLSLKRLRSIFLRPWKVATAEAKRKPIIIN